MNQINPRALVHAFTVAAVVAALGLPAEFALASAHMRAESQSVESLNALLIELNDRATAIERRAKAQQREFTAAEAEEIGSIHDEFAVVEAKRDRAGAGMQSPARARQTNVEVVDTFRPRASSRAVVQPQAQEAKTGGFNSAAEFFGAVRRAGMSGNSPDPRLVVLNAGPNTYGSEGVGSDGGFAVPPDFRATILSKVLGEDSLLALTDQQTSSSNSISFPVDESTPWQSSGGVQAYWEAEGGLKTQSKPTLAEKTVKLHKIIALVPLTDELLEDAPAMASYVNRKAPEKIGFRLNDAIVNGTGLAQPLGILTSPGTVVVAKEAGQPTASVAYANIAKLWTAITPSARRGARWLMHPDVEQQLMTLAFPGSGSTVPAYMPPNGLAGAPYGMLLGKPIMFSEALQPLGSQGDIVFGDLSNYLSIVKAGGIQTAVSIHCFFDYDVTAFRFVLRVGGQPWWNAPIAPYQAGAQARGFFSTLAARP